MHPHFLESRLQSTFKSNYFAPANKVLCDKGALRVKQTLGKNTWKGCVQQPFDPQSDDRGETGHTQPEMRKKGFFSCYG